MQMCNDFTKQRHNIFQKTVLKLRSMTMSLILFNCLLFSSTEENIAQKPRPIFIEKSPFSKIEETQKPDRINLNDFATLKKPDKGGKTMVLCQSRRHLRIR